MTQHYFLLIDQLSEVRRTGNSREWWYTIPVARPVELATSNHSTIRSCACVEQILATSDAADESPRLDRIRSRERQTRYAIADAHALLTESSR